METISNHCGGSFFLFRIDHLKALDGDAYAAICLADMLNILKMKHENKREQATLRKHNLWYKHQAKNVQARLGISEHLQRKAFTTLKKRRIIQIERRAGNSIWIKVDTEALEGLGNSKVQKLKDSVSRNVICQDLETESVKIPYTNNPSKKNTNNPRSDLNGRVHASPIFPNGKSLTKEEEFDREQSRRFCQAATEYIILNQKDITHPDPVIGRRFIAKLRNKKGMEKAEFYIEQYLLHIGEQWYPEAYCPRTFYEKIDQVILALDRDKKKVKTRMRVVGNICSPEMNW